MVAEPRHSLAGICACTDGEFAPAERACAGAKSILSPGEAGRSLSVEVKARASEDAAAFSLDDWRLRRVTVAAERLAPRYMRNGDDVRIDAVFIVPGRWQKHLMNVWQG